MQAEVRSVAGDGALEVAAGPVSMPLAWDRLTDADRRSLARTLGLEE
jgi:hypothetical protein